MLATVPAQPRSGDSMVVINNPMNKSVWVINSDKNTKTQLYGVNFISLHRSDLSLTNKFIFLLDNKINPRK